MSKPLSEDAILVAKALKNFDPERYHYMDSQCCVAGQYYGHEGADYHSPITEKWWRLSDLVSKFHGIDKNGSVDGHKIKFEDGKAIAKALKEEYDLSDAFIAGAK